MSMTPEQTLMILHAARIKNLAEQAEARHDHATAMMLSGIALAVAMGWQHKLAELTGDFFLAMAEAAAKKMGMSAQKLHELAEKKTAPVLVAVEKTDKVQ